LQTPAAYLEKHWVAGIWNLVTEKAKASEVCVEQLKLKWNAQDLSE
jgi:hypothetical protein